MAEERKKGGGFFRGVFYGLFFSVVGFVTLCAIYPLIEAEPVAVVPDLVQTAPQAFDVGPGNSDVSGVLVGANSDFLPSVSIGGGLDVSSTVEQPLIETASADVPDIGQSSDSVVETAPVIIAAPLVAVETPQPVAISVQEPDAVIAQESAPPALPDAESGDAFDIFAVPFERDAKRAMFAIVFEDTLEASLQGLFDADIPLNFAVLGTNSDLQMSQGFREIGFEVLALLPPNLQIDENLSQNISEYINNVPAAIGVIDNFVGSVMRDGPATQVLIETAAVNGMGTIGFSGLGATNARNISKFYGRPFGSVFRIIDENDDVDLIRQALDQATLSAETGGSAIIYARTSDATIDVILEWLNSVDRDSIQIVPISQIMRPD